jgi:hypothetical protein
MLPGLGHCGNSALKYVELNDLAFNNVQREWLDLIGEA